MSIVTPGSDMLKQPGRGQRKLPDGEAEPEPETVS